MFLINSYLMPLINFSGYFFVFISKYNSFTDLIIYGIPWSFIITFYVYFCGNGICLYLFYFNSICYYFKVKLRRQNLILKSILKQINSEIIQIVPSKRQLLYLIKLKVSLIKLNKIYIEIDQFNREFWSKQLFIALLFYLTIICGLLYQLTFGQSKSIMFISVLYFTIINIIICLLFIITTSSMSNEANRAYSIVYNLNFALFNLKVLFKFKVK